MRKDDYCETSEVRKILRIVNDAKSSTCCGRDSATNEGCKEKILLSLPLDFGAVTKSR
jgi:hypothetical protein